MTNKFVKEISLADIESTQKLLPHTGCTAIYPNHYPEVLTNSGYISRNKANNERFSIRLGSVISIDLERPDEIYIGDTNLDSKDSFNPDEDMYVINKQSQTIRKLTGNSINKYNSNYINVHHGNKDYFGYQKLIGTLKLILSIKKS